MKRAAPLAIVLFALTASAQDGSRVRVSTLHLEGSIMRLGQVDHELERVMVAELRVDRSDGEHRGRTVLLATTCSLDRMSPRHCGRSEVTPWALLRTGGADLNFVRARGARLERPWARDCVPMRVLSQDLVMQPVHLCEASWPEELSAGRSSDVPLPPTSRLPHVTRIRGRVVGTSELSAEDATLTVSELVVEQIEGAPIALQPRAAHVERVLVSPGQRLRVLWPARGALPPGRLTLELASAALVGGELPYLHLDAGDAMSGDFRVVEAGQVGEPLRFVGQVSGAVPPPQVGRRSRRSPAIAR